MYKVLTLNQISVKGLDRFPRDEYELASEFSNPDAILLRSHKLGTEEIADTVMCIGRAGAGTNNIPVTECTVRGIPVFNAPGANANAVKELVAAALLLGSRGIVEGISYVDTLKDVSDEAASRWCLRQPRNGPRMSAIGRGGRAAEGAGLENR